MIVCICRGGLANRLKPLASCHSFARETGRTLAVNWPADGHCGAAFSDLYGNPIREITFDTIFRARSLKLYADLPFVRGLGFAELLRMIEEFDSAPLSRTSEIPADSQELIVVYGNDYLEGVNPDFFHGFFESLQPVEKISRTIHLAREELGINREIIGVHARGTDFGSPVESYLRQMKEEKQRNPGARFFVCSDSLDYEQRILSEFPDTILHAKNAYAEKLDKTNGWSMENIKRSGGSVADAVVDMHLLAASDFRIYNPYSSFAHVVNLMAHGKIERFPNSAPEPPRSWFKRGGRFIKTRLQQVWRVMAEKKGLRS